MRGWGLAWVGCALLLAACDENAGSGADAGPHEVDASDDAGQEPRDASREPLRDAGASDAAPDSMAPAANVVVPCAEQYPDYDCDTSVSVFDNTDLDYLLEHHCGDCHHSDADGVFPPFMGDTTLVHDAVLMLTDLDNPRESPLLGVIADEHHCSEPCLDDEYDWEYELLDWQNKISLRKSRLESLADARQRWLDLGITRYQWHVRNSCFGCSAEWADNAFAAVNDGEVEALLTGEVHTSATPLTRVSPSMAQSWHTVSGLFETIESAINRDPDTLKLAYDPTLRYPTRAAIDYHLDWDDEEDDYFAEAFVELAGYCVAQGPFAIDEAEQALPRCSSTDDCASCAPMSDLGVACTESSWCRGDAECGSGYVCEPIDRRCPDAALRCVSECSADSCDAGYSCTDGHCVPGSCADDSSLCFSAELCQPEEPNANPFGCLPPSCDQTDVGCVATCASDQDCGCGSCVNGQCSATPGVCH